MRRFLMNKKPLVKRAHNKNKYVSIDAVELKKPNALADYFSKLRAFMSYEEKLQLYKEISNNILKAKQLPTAYKMYQEIQPDKSVRWLDQKPGKAFPGATLSEYLKQVLKKKDFSPEVYAARIIEIIEELNSGNLKSNSEKMNHAIELGQNITLLSIYNSEDKKQYLKALKPRTNDDVEAIIENLSKTDSSMKKLWRLFENKLDADGFQPRIEANDKGNERVQYNNDSSKNGRKSLAFSTFEKKIRKYRN